MKNIFILVLINLCALGNLTGQTGINTTAPLKPLHIDAAKDNSAIPTISEKQNDVVVDQTGRMGIGVENPAVKLDLRSGTNVGIIGIGNTTQSAAAVQGGAMRYNPTLQVLEYSDGVAWHPLANSPPPKAMLVAKKNTAQTVTQNNASQYITGWDVQDSDGGAIFDAGTGIFTAPRDGFYIVSFNVTFASATIANNSRVETIVETNQAANNNPTFISVNAYTGWQGGALPNNFTSGSCNAIFNLQAGSTIRFRVWHNLGGNRSIHIASSGDYNSLSISEL